MKIGVAEWLHGWCKVNRFSVLIDVKTKCFYIVEKSSVCKNGTHSLVSVILYQAHEVGCDTDLDSVELWPGGAFVEGM